MSCWYSVLLTLPLVATVGCDSGRTHVIVRTTPEPVPTSTDFLSGPVPAKAFDPLQPLLWQEFDSFLTNRFGADKFLPTFVQQQEYADEEERAHSVRVTARNWRTKYERYSRALTARAAEARLDSVSLSNVLKVILADAERDKMAYLPFAAYKATARSNEEPVWIVDLAWEYECMMEGGLGHIRTYAVSARTMARIGFRTCM